MVPENWLVRQKVGEGPENDPLLASYLEPCGTGLSVIFAPQGDVTIRIGNVSCVTSTSTLSPDDDPAVIRTQCGRAATSQTNSTA